MTVFHSKPLRLLAQVLLYLAVITALVVMYGSGDFSTPSFIYQNF